jgi:hypothetical protein
LQLEAKDMVAERFVGDCLTEDAAFPLQDAGFAAAIVSAVTNTTKKQRAMLVLSFEGSIHQSITND